MQKKKVTSKKAPRVNKALATVREDVERTYGQSDSRVINRQLGLFIHEQLACEEHLAGLKASIVEVQNKKSRVEAKIAGLTVVLGKRG